MSHVWDGCGAPSPAAYGEFTLAVNRDGPSGSGVYDLQQGKPRLVGIFGKGFKKLRYFLPLDQIYADKVTASGTSKPGGTIHELMRGIYKQRRSDGMPRV